MMKCVWFIVYIATKALCFEHIEHDFRGFDDNILFGINWPGTDDHIKQLLDSEEHKHKKWEQVEVVSSDNEKYVCHIPEAKKVESTKTEEYSGPSPLNLLKPLFSQKICSYRIESYWSYEVCHGRYVRQYHEERDGKQVKTQEYYLGYWNAEKQQKFEEDDPVTAEKEVSPYKTTKVEGQALPYVEMVLEDGTMCDLNEKPRLTRVKYVCYSHGKHEVFSFKETSTCEYEIIILSPLLCEHPEFKPQEISENTIECIPVDGAPKKPSKLLQMEVDSLRFQHQTIKMRASDMDPKDILAVLKVEKIEKDGETHLKFELHPLNEDEDIKPDNLKEISQLIEKKHPVITDDSPVRAFLNGENCLNGGTGWWKYEFCYGKHVTQYHIDRDGEKSTLLLGKFDEQTHLDWIKENKGKAPKPVGQRTSISHFYSNGDTCDKTGKPRQTEVKLKCLENASSPAQVSLYLLEPRTCHYILGVESPLICDILPHADDTGLINSTKSALKDYSLLDSLVEADENAENKEEVVPKVEND